MVAEKRIKARLDHLSSSIEFQVQTEQASV
jgi:hypothetical protein